MSDVAVSIFFESSIRESFSSLRFMVRDFVYDEETMKAGKNERDKLVAEKQRQVNIFSFFVFISSFERLLLITVSSLSQSSSVCPSHPMAEDQLRRDLRSVHSREGPQSLRRIRSQVWSFREALVRSSS